MNHPHESQAAAMSRVGELTDGEQLRECVNSGQVSAAQAVVHQQTGEEALPPHDLHSARRELAKWLNEEQIKPIDRQALAVVLAHVREAVAHQEAPETERQALYRAAIHCKHEIDTDTITLHRDPRLPGNALSQMADRLDAARSEAMQEVERYRAGNTALLEALMDMVGQFFMCGPDDVLRHSFMFAEEQAIAVLIQAGMAEEVEPNKNAYRLKWDALEARKLARHHTRSQS